MSFQSRGRSAALTAAISVILASPALAGEPAPGGIQLEEIVVTAQRTETNLQQTPISVTAVSGDALAKQGASTLLDLATFIPNLQVGSTTLQGGGNGRFAIRGIGQDAGSQAAVGLYVDEVFYASGAGNLMGLFDVDRVEVLRGPQGTLFGRNTIGGAIQYVTVKPGKEFGGYVEATGGNFGRTDFAGALNIPLGETLAARVSVGYNSKDGFVHDRLNNIDRGSDERKAARLQVRWTPTGSLTVDVKGEWLGNENNGRASVVRGYDGTLFPTGQNDGSQFPELARNPFVASVPATGHLCPSIIPNGPCTDVSSPGKYEIAGFNAPDYAKLDYYAGAAVVNWDVNDAVTLKSITGYSETESEAATDTDNSPFSFIRIGGGDPNKSKVLSEELQLRLNLLNNRLHWTTGLYYYDQQSEAAQGALALGAGPAQLGTFNTPESKLESKAVFTQATFDFTDRFSGTVGVRYSDENFSTQSQSFSSAPPGPLYEGSFTDTSPQVGVQFQATEDLMVYANAAKGFRAGGIGLNQGFANGLKNFDPEEAWTYELGTRMEFMDRRLRVNPTVFFTDWKDIQVNTLITIPEPGAPCLSQPSPFPGPPNACNPGVATAIQNKGDAEIKGLELEALFQATDRLTLQASFGYLDANYTSVRNVNNVVYPASLGGFFGGGALQVPNLCDGKDDQTLAQLNPNRTAGQLAPFVPLYECKGASIMSRAPEFKFSVGATYAIPLASGAQIVTSADYGWTDEQGSEVAELDQVLLPSFGVLNARVQYNSPDNKWSLAVFGTNLTDEYYYLGSTDFAAGYTVGTTSFDPARPLEYGATFKFNF